MEIITHNIFTFPHRPPFEIINGMVSLAVAVSGGGGGPSPSLANIGIVTSGYNYQVAKNIDIQIPSGVEDGQLMLAHLLVDGSTIQLDDIYGPEGWNLLGHIMTTPFHCHGVWWRIANSEPSGYAWGWDGGNTEESAIYLVTLSGINPSNPFDWSEQYPKVYYNYAEPNLEVAYINDAYNSLTTEYGVNGVPALRDNQFIMHFGGHEGNNLAQFPKAEASGGYSIAHTTPYSSVLSASLVYRESPNVEFISPEFMWRAASASHSLTSLVLNPTVLSTNTKDTERVHVANYTQRFTPYTLVTEQQISLPSGTEVGDVMLALIAIQNRGSETPSFEDSGANTWTHEFSARSLFGYQELQVFSRVVDGTEGASGTYNTSTAEEFDMVVLNLKNVDTTNIIDTGGESGINYIAGLNEVPGFSFVNENNDNNNKLFLHCLLGINTGYNMFLGWHGYGVERDASGLVSFPTTDAGRPVFLLGQTYRDDVEPVVPGTWNCIDNNIPTTAIGFAINGKQRDVDIIPSVVRTKYTEQTSTKTPVFDYPDTVTSGNLLTLVIASDLPGLDKDEFGPTTDKTWKLVYTGKGGGGNTAIFTKRADGSEAGGSAEFHSTYSSTTDYAGIILEIKNASQDLPFGRIREHVEGFVLNPETPEIETTHNNVMLLNVYAADEDYPASGSGLAPSGWTTHGVHQFGTEAHFGVATSGAPTSGTFIPQQLWNLTQQATDGIYSLTIEVYPPEVTLGDKIPILFGDLSWGWSLDDTDNAISLLSGGPSLQKVGPVHTVSGIYGGGAYFERNTINALQYGPTSLFDIDTDDETMLMGLWFKPKGLLLQDTALQRILYWPSGYGPEIDIQVDGDIEIDWNSYGSPLASAITIFDYSEHLSKIHSEDDWMFLLMHVRPAEPSGNNINSAYSEFIINANSGIRYQGTAGWGIWGDPGISIGGHNAFDGHAFASGIVDEIFFYRKRGHEILSDYIIDKLYNNGKGLFYVGNR